MSIRRRASQRATQPTQKDLDHLKVLEYNKIMSERLGMTVEEYESSNAISEMAGSLDDMIRDQKFKKMSDMPTKDGIVIPDPHTGDAAGYLDNVGDLRGMSGQFHPATERWLQRVGKL